jgi:RNA polymerase sigma-70 factor (ECF subfamily)
VSPKPQRPSRKTEVAIVGRLREVQAEALTASPSLAHDLERLFASHRGRVQALCLRMVGNPERAEELVQDTLLTAYQKLPEFRGDARFSTWIYSIARNRCFNAIKKHGELLTTDGVIEAEDAGASVLSSLTKGEREELVRAAAAEALDPEEQEVVHLRYVEGLPLETITDLLELPGSGARAVLQRSRRKLASEIKTRLEELGHGASFFRTRS